MSAKAILEADGKAILNYHLTRAPVFKPTPLANAKAVHNPAPRLASLYFAKDANVKDVLDQAEVNYPWLLQSGAKFVAKPDQLIKRRGKSGLLALNKTWPEAKQWIQERAGKSQRVESIDGVLRQFLVEPFVPHPQDTEYYICINSAREVRLDDGYAYTLLTIHRATGSCSLTRAVSTLVMLMPRPKRCSSQSTCQSTHQTSRLPLHCCQRFQRVCTMFLWISSRVSTLFTSTANSRRFVARYSLHKSDTSRYLEINPLVVVPNADATSADVFFLDLAAKLDQTAEFECGVKWAIARSPAALGMPNVAAKDAKVTVDAGPPMEFPAPFGRELSKEEAYIAEMDAKTGASLKLTILNAEGRVWTLVAGGGASVVYADAIASAGFASELANYGEYSGAPSETQTFHYARTVFDLMLRSPLRPEGKVLFIGGGIANFTNVCL